jgi:hypothetical protein
VPLKIRQAGLAKGLAAGYAVGYFVEMLMKAFLTRLGPTSLRIVTILVAAILGAACGTTGPSLKVNTPPEGHLGAYKSVQIVCTAEDEKEKGKEYTGRLESQLLVKLRERDMFQEYKLSKDEGKTDLTLKAVILDLKKSGGYAWYGRSSSKVACDVTMIDNQTNATVVSISLVAKPRYSNIETALEDAATQIADYLREHK